MIFFFIFLYFFLLTTLCYFYLTPVALFHIWPTTKNWTRRNHAEAHRAVGEFLQQMEAHGNINAESNVRYT